MKKTWIIMSLLLFILCTLITFRAYHYYAPPLIRQPYKVTNNENYSDTIHIAYVGDSWAYIHKSHDCKIAQIIADSTHRPVSVHSLGICGLTSKEIYEHIFDDSEFNIFMQARKYDYCFISAGINDTYKKMSSRYYKKSMEGIIEFLLANHIHPIILEIPDYNIIKAYDNQTTDKKLLRQFSMFINGTSLDCKQDFRNALDELIERKDYKNIVWVVRYKSWNNDYAKDLKTMYCHDQMHLNEKGYLILDSLISNEIIKHQHFSYHIK